MMRKFRGKTKEGTWVYGDLNQAYIDSDGDSWPTIIYNHLDENRYPVEVIPETVGQSTGLKDKNGKEIFEGDKLLIEWVGKEVTEQRGVVYWNTERHRWDCDTATFPSKNWRRTKVIGNIHSK